MAKTKYFYQVRGYNEEFNKWGGDDDNLRIRLNILGIPTYLDESAILIHREEKTKKDKRYLKQQTQRYSLFLSDQVKVEKVKNGKCKVNSVYFLSPSGLSNKSLKLSNNRLILLGLLGKLKETLGTETIS